MLGGFYISRFRNFDDKDQFVGPLSKINIFIGQNNSGKSNVLRFIRDVLGPLHEQKSDTTKKVPSISQPLFSFNMRQGQRILLKTDRETVEKIFTRQMPNGYDWHSVFKTHPSSVDNGDFCEVDIIKDGYGRIGIVEGSLPAWSHPNLQLVWSHLTNQQGGGAQLWQQELFGVIANRQLTDLNTLYIPSFRQINTRLPEFFDEYASAGEGDHIIDDLAKLAYPAYNEQDKKKRFEKLRRFIAEVIDRPDLYIEIPTDRTTINVMTDGNVIPLEALGSGIHELFMLAAKLVINENNTVLLEEPEIHMHPTLQKKFLNFISRELQGQFFITTHSAHIIDTESASVFGIENRDGKGYITPLITSTEKRRMCTELGYKPSDLLQSNSIIWVEGPSDRIYVNHWIKAYDASLKEGIHYSVMFYGGKLLSHLSLGDLEVEDFIALLPINRHPIVVMDSDLGGDGQEIRDTKKRVIDQLAVVGGCSWVTQGREIENYLSTDMRLRAIQSAHPKAARLVGGANRYAKPLDYEIEAGTRVSAGFDKVRIAKYVASQPPDLAPFDLAKRIEAVVAFIRAAN